MSKVIAGALLALSVLLSGCTCYTAHHEAHWHFWIDHHGYHHARWVPAYDSTNCT